MVDEHRQDAWDKALDAFGTAYIFQRRARGPKVGMRILAFTGLVLPLALGLYVTVFGREAPQLERAIVLAGVLAGVQAIVSLWALVAKWDDQYTTAIESMVANNRLSTRFKSLARTPPANANAIYEALIAENESREEADVKQLLTDKEKRMGMRAALREFERRCASCKDVPRSMKPTQCPVCGDF
jgi:mobilome CxxCx(11)CxxC protein